MNPKGDKDKKKTIKKVKGKASFKKGHAKRKEPKAEMPPMPPPLSDDDDDDEEEEAGGADGADAVDSPGRKARGYQKHLFLKAV